MAKIDIKDTVAHDRETVYKTFRDELTELIPHLPDVKNIEVQKREEVDENTTRVVNLWTAEAEEIPRVARPFIKPEMLVWTDVANWHDDTWACDWVIEVGFLSEAVTCKGSTKYLEKGADKTEVVITGQLDVNAKEIPGVPRLGAGKIGSVIESFVVRLITPNLTNINRGLERYLA